MPGQSSASRTRHEVVFRASIALFVGQRRQIEVKKVAGGGSVMIEHI
jgi:hypothetical protein